MISRRRPPICLQAMKRLGAVVLVWAAGSGLGPTALFGQEMPVPVEEQVKFFSTIWSFDRAHAARLEDGFVVGIAFQERYRTSLLAKNDFEEEIRGQLDPNGDGNLIVVPLDVTDPAQLAQSMAAAGVDVLYVAPLRAVDVRELATVTREARILTVTGVPEYVLGSGISVGLGNQGGQAEILINLEASRGEGAQFTSRLLRHATLVSGEQDQ